MNHTYIEAVSDLFCGYIVYGQSTVESVFMLHDFLQTLVRALETANVDPKGKKVWILTAAHWYTLDGAMMSQIFNLEIRSLSFMESEIQHIQSCEKVMICISQAQKLAAHVLLFYKHNLQMKVVITWTKLLKKIRACDILRNKLNDIEDNSLFAHHWRAIKSIM